MRSCFVAVKPVVASCLGHNDSIEHTVALPVRHLQPQKRPCLQIPEMHSMSVAVKCPSSLTLEDSDRICRRCTVRTGRWEECNRLLRGNKERCYLCITRRWVSLSSESFIIVDFTSLKAPLAKRLAVLCLDNACAFQTDALGHAGGMLKTLMPTPRPRGLQLPLVLPWHPEAATAVQL